MTWEEAVIATKSWYERNIHEYNQSGFKDSGELGVGMVRKDCSGFVSACLRKAGMVPMNFLTQSRGILTNGYDANKLKSAGFIPLKWDLSKAQPFDIFVVAGHTEIYAGNSKSYNWGSVHDLNKGGMPSGTSHLKSGGYSVMWRHPSVSGNIPPDVDYASSNDPISNGNNSSFSGGFSNSALYANNGGYSFKISPNTVYTLASNGEKKDVLKIDDHRKNDFESLRTSLITDMIQSGRDVIKSPELYNSSILKSGQSAKIMRT